MEGVEDRVLLYKKGDKEDSKNYRKQKLLLFILHGSLMNSNRENKSNFKEIAAKRREFYSIFALKQLKERASEYNLSLMPHFRHYEKAPDSAKFECCAAEEGIDRNYVKFIRDANMDCSTSIIRMTIERGVRQGDFVDKLFTACLQILLRQLNWEGGVTGNGERLNHLRFAANVILIATVLVKHTMLQELNARSKEVGLKINASKMKVSRVPACLAGRRYRLGVC